MKIDTVLDSDTLDDARLVQLSLEGDREAFGQLVSRYQSPVCALAYSTCGSISRSEDVAQETFITAWRQLRALKEPARFKAWLYGIARNLLGTAFRQQTRNPLATAEPLDESVAEAAFANPTEQAITREEEAILWQVLAGMPEIYREPMILYYREGESHDRVAEVLGISEEGARQRLSRGRAMLNERVARLVESGLRRSVPGKAFTIGVIAALPALTYSAKAASLGASAAKGGAAVKTAGMLGALAAVFGSLLIVFGNYANYRIGLEESRNESERRYVRSFFRKISAITVGLFIVAALPILWMRPAFEYSSLFEMLFVELMVIYFPTTLALYLFQAPAQRRYFSGVLAAEHAGVFPEAAWEYRSHAEFLGLPLVHIRIGDRFDVLRPPVKAWIAVANYAVGGLFAFGGITIAPVCIGFCGIGLVPFAALAAGVFSTGAVSIGVWAAGGLAFGWQAVGCFAVAWNAAAGNVALAHDFAVGALARAAQAGNDAAKSFIGSNGFFRFSEAAAGYSLWLNLLWVVPSVIQWRIIAAKRSLTRRAN
jgi:RNA polymerase sigma factor (sigma-70 family)